MPDEEVEVRRVASRGVILCAAVGTVPCRFEQVTRYSGCLPEWRMFP